MGKTYETKRRIMGMLEESNHNLTELSRMLTLSPSTVSQHLKELQESGIIRMIDNPHFRKLKYYSRVREDGLAEESEVSKMINYQGPSGQGARRRVWYY